MTTKSLETVSRSQSFVSVETKSLGKPVSLALLIVPAAGFKPTESSLAYKTSRKSTFLFLFD